MQFDVRSNIVEVGRWMTDAQRRQLPFASALAMTRTAKDIQAQEIVTMRRVFDRPTPYTLNALRVVPARKTTLEAKVEFRDWGAGTPAKRFLNPEVHGGPRSQKGFERRLGSIINGVSYWRPASGAPLNAFGNITGGQIKRVLSQMGSQDQGFSAATKSRRSKAKRSAKAFFKHPTKALIMERRGKKAFPFLVAVRNPTYPKRFPFYEVAGRVLRDRLGPNFVKAFDQAMATSAVKSSKTTMSIAGQYDAWRSSPAGAVIA